VRGHGQAAGRLPIRPTDPRAPDDEAWKRQSEMNSRNLQMMNVIEIMVEGDVADVVIKLDPK
jgi:hypothetical protein